MLSNWLNIYFRPGKDDDLMAWVRQEGRANFGLFGREAFECYRLFNGSLAQAQEAATALAEIKRREADKELVK